MRYFILFALCFLFAPAVANASVYINEIAWMGTSVSANDEWIEIYNESNESVDITGWRLFAVDGTPEITLSGSITPNGYFLLERSDDNTVSSVTADIIYSGGLGNGGELLKLVNSENDEIDSVDHIDGWQAGDNATKKTMQRTGANWITSEATPRAANSTTGSPGVESAPESEIPINDSETMLADNVSFSTVETDPAYRAEVEIPKYTIVGQPIKIFGKVSRNDSDMFRGAYVWSMGDGVRYENKKNIHHDFDFEHTYYRAGIYTIVFKYYSNTFMIGDPLVTHKSVIYVPEKTISIIDINFDGTVTLKNNTKHEVDLGGWRLDSLESGFTLPEDTFIRPMQSLALSPKVTNLNVDDSSLVSLQTPTGMVSSSHAPVYSVAVSIDIKSKNDDNNANVDIAKLPYSLVSKDSPIVSLDNKSNSFTVVQIIFMMAISLLTIIFCIFLYKKTSQE